MFKKRPVLCQLWEYLLSHLGSSIIRKCHTFQYSNQRLGNRSIECDVNWRHHFYVHGFVHNWWVTAWSVFPTSDHITWLNFIQRWTQSFEYHGFFVLQNEFGCAYEKPRIGQLIYSKFTLHNWPHESRKPIESWYWYCRAHWFTCINLWTLSEPWKVPFPSESTRIINSVGNWSISSIDTKHHVYCC